MDDYSKILDYLHEQREQRPELAEVIDLHLALFSAQSQAKVSAAPSGAEQATDEKTTQAALEQGRPLLTLDSASMDWDEFEQLFDQVCRLSAQHRPDLAEAFEDIRALAGSNQDQARPGRAREQSRIRTLATDYLAKGHTHPAESLGLNGELLDFVLNNALHPFLRAQAAALSPSLDDDLWYRGYCPACGGEPDLAVFGKETGARRLLCSRCDTEWAFKRVACPFCGNEDPRQLAHYPGEDGGYRLDVCEACGRYLKTLDRREAWREAPLPAERVLTVGMDLAAANKGYHAR